MRKTGLPRRAVVLVLLGLVVASATAVTATVLRRPDAPVATASPHDALATLPIAFEPAGGGFVSRGPGYSFTLTPAGATVGVAGGRFALRPAGPLANPAAELVAADPLGATVSRITGNDPSQWRTGAPTFARVAARQVWPGVDMVWHGDQRRLEHDMIVAAGVDPAVVAFEVDGARTLTVDAAGGLVVDFGSSTATLAKPVLYQEVGGARRPVDGAFNLLGPSHVGFTVGAYDRSLPLVIDPTLQTSTLLGGAGPDAGYAIAVDTQGNTYVAGTTESGDFPTTDPLQKALSGAAGTPSADVFVSKISPDGSKLIWSTYLGGGGRDTGFAVAVGGDGTVYVSGVTESPDFPVARGAQTTYGGGASDGFVARIAANGTGIEWSSFIGGGGTDRARGLAIDSTGNAYLTGSTNSDNFPSVNAQQPGPFRAEDLDAFVTKFPAGGAPLTFSTRLGGGNDDRGLAIAVDAQGAVYVTGDTLSPGFPTVRPIQASSGGSAGGVVGAFTDAFVAKYNPTGGALVYSTFLGGSDFDQGTAITVDGQGAAYVAGNTNSPNFPTVGALQGAKSNDPDAFVTKIDPPGGALVYSTYLGGNGADGANGIAVDRAGSAHVVGTTGSANFVSAKATQLAKSGGDDAFVVKLDSTGRGPLFASFLGGRDTDAGMGVALTAQGGVRVLGLTGSADFPSVKPVQGAKPPASGDAFVAALELTDPAAPPTTAAAAVPATSAASASTDEAHDRRVRTFGLIFVVLLVAAIAQTAYLRRRTPAPVPTRGSGGRPPSRPPAKTTPPRKAAPANRAAPASQAGKAEAGVTVLDRTSPETVTPPSSAKGGGGQKGTSAQKKAAASRKAAERRARKEQAAAAAAAATATAAAAAATVVAPPAPADPEPPAVVVPPAPVENDDGGPPTMATPPPPSSPKTKPHVPAIAALLEEDLWAPEPSEAAEGEADETPGPPAAAVRQDAQAAPEWAPFDTGSVPAVGDDAPPPPPPPQPGVPIPPVPAAELSFWDLFPEDLPPARSAPFPAADVVVEHLALPEGPDSAAERLANPDAPPEPAPAPAEHAAEVDPLQVASPEPQRPLQRPEAEIVIAELLDGPPPTGTRMSAESQWAPRPDEDDIFINDLLVAPPGEDDGHEATADDPTDDDPTDDAGHDDLAAAARRANAPDQARIAADRARRRRSRRGGGRGNQPGSG
jgi:hypothetical protein